MQPVLKKLTIALAAMLALTVVAASTASAASPEWYVKKNKVFEKVSKEVTVQWSGSFELLLEKGYLGLPLSFSCTNGETKGFVGPGGTGSTEYSFFKPPSPAVDCKNTSEINKEKYGCERFGTWMGYGTPLSELYSEGTEKRIRFFSKEEGEPGVKFSCQIINEVSINCGVVTSAHTVNNTTLGLVEVVFDAKSAKVPCAENGKETGEWKATMKVAPSARAKEEGVEAIKVE
jgi:hypothetical protein